MHRQIPEECEGSFGLQVWGLQAPWLARARFMSTELSKRLVSLPFQGDHGKRCLHTPHVFLWPPSAFPPFPPTPISLN